MSITPTINSGLGEPVVKDVSLTTYQPNALPNPGAMMIKSLYAIIAD